MEKAPSGFANFEANAEAALASNAHLSAIETRIVSPEVSALNDAAMFEIYGSNIPTTSSNPNSGEVKSVSNEYTVVDPATGAVIGSPEAPLKGKLDQIRESRNYGTKPAERTTAAEKAAEKYEADVLSLVDGGLELCQAKLVMDMREADQSEKAKRMAELMGTGVSPATAKSRVNKIYEAKDAKRVTLIKEGGAFTAEEYARVRKGEDLYAAPQTSDGISEVNPEQSTTDASAEEIDEANAMNDAFDAEATERHENWMRYLEKRGLVRRDHNEADDLQSTDPATDEEYNKALEMNDAFDAERDAERERDLEHLRRYRERKQARLEAEELAARQEEASSEQSTDPASAAEEDEAYATNEAMDAEAAEEAAWEEEQARAEAAANPDQVLAEVATGGRVSRVFRGARARLRRIRERGVRDNARMAGVAVVALPGRIKEHYTNPEQGSKRRKILAGAIGALFLAGTGYVVYKKLQHGGGGHPHNVADLVPDGSKGGGNRGGGNFDPTHLPPAPVPTPNATQRINELATDARAPWTHATELNGGRNGTPRLMELVTKGEGLGYKIVGNGKGGGHGAINSITTPDGAIFTDNAHINAALDVIAGL